MGDRRDGSVVTIHAGAVKRSVQALDIPSLFAHLYWTEGAEFIALGLADGASVSPWPDEVGVENLTNSNAARRPIYVASDATFNGKPVLRFDGSDDSLGDLYGASVAAPFEVVCIARYRALGNDYIYSLGPSGTGAELTEQFTVYNTGFGTGGTADTTQHFFRAVYDPGGTELFIDEVSTITGAGTAVGFDLDGVTIARSSIGASSQLDIVLWGVSSGLLTAAERTALHAWAQTNYGTP